MNRRKFMARAAALNAGLLTVPRAFSARLRSSTAPRLHRVVADTRFAPGAAFAAAMARKGTPVSATDGDLTSLWFDDLRRHFEGSGAPVAGLTSARTALVMTELARGPGVRVLWRGQHVPLPDGSLLHEFHGTAALVARAAALGSAADWSAGLAAVVADAAQIRSRRMPPFSAAVRIPRAPGSLEETLSSWVLAPRGTARDTADG